MREYSVRPTVLSFNSCAEFADAMRFDESDLIITNSYIFCPAFDKTGIKAHLLYQENFGSGEPSDEMVEAMAAAVTGQYGRIIAIGGGTVIDIAKLFALKTFTPILDLFDGKIPAVKSKELIIVPTTCGTGSEMTNLSILALLSRNTKMGFACDQMYADKAVLIPELLKSMPFYTFATSSIDALIHAVESRVSPNATDFTKMLSEKAASMIIRGYQRIAAQGRQVLPELLRDFLFASNYAGVAFGNAGCGAVHALSYPIGGTHHVPHGEANYAVFTGVFKAYYERVQDGVMGEIVDLLCSLLNCPAGRVFDELDRLIENILPKKQLHEYGITKAELKEMTDCVMTTQGRLMARNAAPLDENAVLEIYEKLF